jgi:hypothetical protein
MEAGDLVADKRQRRGSGFFISRFAWTDGHKLWTARGRDTRGRGREVQSLRRSLPDLAGRVLVDVVDAAREGLTDPTGNRRCWKAEAAAAAGPPCAQRALYLYIIVVLYYDGRW